MALVLILATGVGACSGAATHDDGTARAARAWATAATRDDPEAAYELLSITVRTRVSYEDFVRSWRAHPRERARQAAAIEAAARAGKGAGERGALLLPDGETTDVAREPGGWRLSRALVAAFRPSTPTEALQRLADAVEARSVQGILHLLSSDRQEAARDLLDSFAAGLRAHASDLFEISEDRAVLLWTDGTRRWRVTLKREQGAWRVDDFSPL